MKFKTGTLLWTFFWCWFMGITVISIGFGAIFPSMNLVAKPLVCPGGKMDLEKQVHNPYPGRTTTSLTWYCIDETSGVKTELSIFPTSLVAGTIYGALLFVAVVIGMMLLSKRKPGLPQENFASLDSVFKSTEDILTRMKELKDLYTANLISETEYEEQRGEILRSI